MGLGQLPFPFQLLLIELAAPSDKRQPTGDDEGEPRDPHQERHCARHEQEHSAQGDGDLHKRWELSTLV